MIDGIYFDFEVTEKRSQPIQAYKPIWILAAENNAKRKVVKRRKASDDSIFMGCQMKLKYRDKNATRNWLRFVSMS